MDYLNLADRERTVLEIVTRLGKASVADVAAETPDNASTEAVRAALRVLRQKGLVRHVADGKRYLYQPTSNQKVQQSVINRIVSLFFGGSRIEAATALLRASDARLSIGELDRLAAEIERARARATGNTRR